MLGLCILVLVGLMVLPTDAFAYIDPGAGSVGYQVLLVSLLAGAVAIRRAVAWVVRVFSLRRDSAQPLDDADHSA